MIDAVGRVNARSAISSVSGTCPPGEKDGPTYWTINQRMFRFETFVMLAPEENEQAFYEHLLMRNRELTGMNLEIGDEHATRSLARQRCGTRSGPRLDVGLCREGVPSCSAHRFRQPFGS